LKFDQRSVRDDLAFLGERNDALGDGFDDLLVDLVYGEVAFNENDAVGLARGDLAIFLPDATKEGVLLGFKAVFVAAGFGFHAVVATARAGQRRLEAGQQQEGEIGLKAAADEAMEVEHNFRAELAAAALVGFCRISEAVADDDLACIEGWLDDFGDGLGAIAKHESHLGHGVEATRAGVEQDFANAITDGGAAGLAEQDGFVAAAGEPCRQALDLGGFSGAVEALEGDENTARHGLSLSPVRLGVGWRGAARNEAGDYSAE
jgi:hypothetical protein